jgi:hypothetical protein
MVPSNKLFSALAALASSGKISNTKKVQKDIFFMDGTSWLNIH